MSNTWPIAADLQVFLQGSGFTINMDEAAQFGLQRAMDSAVEQFEKDTGWLPFLGAPTTLLFDPPGPDKCGISAYFGINTVGGSRRLSLGLGLLMLTSLSVWITPTDPVGEILTLGQHFWLKPDNFAFYNKPATSIEFAIPQYGPPQSIQVIGTFGRMLTPTAAVTQAVLTAAAIICAPKFSVGVSSGLLDWKEGEQEEKYAGSGSSGPFAHEVALWRKQYDATVRAYRSTAIF